MYFTSSRVGQPAVFRKRADGMGDVEPVMPSPNFQAPYEVSPDGSVLVFGEARPGTQGDIGIMHIDDDEVEWLIATEAQEQNPRLSPDGLWIAYASDTVGGDRRCMSVHSRT